MVVLHAEEGVGWSRIGTDDGVERYNKVIWQWQWHHLILICLRDEA